MMMMYVVCKSGSFFELRKKRAIFTHKKLDRQQQHHQWYHHGTTVCVSAFMSMSKYHLLSRGGPEEEGF